MFDIWIGDVELTALTLIISLVLLLPVQLLLCFKVKNRYIRLLPLIILSLLTVTFVFLSISTLGWDGLGYTFLAIFAGFMLFICGAAWGIWAVVKLRKRSKGGDI